MREFRVAMIIVSWVLDEVDFVKLNLVKAAFGYPNKG